MTADELIGSTSAALISHLAGRDDAPGTTARFLLDRLTEIQVGAICTAIAARTDLRSRTQMRIPRSIGETVGLPQEILTDERSTFWRNAECDLPVLVLANTEDDQGQSLKDVTPIGSAELLSFPALWVEQVSSNLVISDSHLKSWTQALKGLLDAKPLSLDSFAAYLLDTRAALDEGLPIVEALGSAVPALRAPKDSAYFNAIPKAALGHASRWRRLYQKLFSSRAPYLVKVGPNQQPISTETLQESFAKVKDEIDPAHHQLFVDFIDSESNWNDAAKHLAQLEWENDKVKSLFDGLRVKPEPLGKNTLAFYEDEFPEALTEDDREFLGRLDQRNTREASEEDTSFYDRHRYELSQNRTLKLKWEKFIFGQPLETDDFYVGLLRVLERLFEQAGPTANRRTLVIECRRSKREWLEMNFDAVCYFARRYRGLRALTHGTIEWQTPHLFDFASLVQEEERRGRYERTETTKRTANQIKFIVRLAIFRTDTEEEYTTQLIWTFNPQSVLSKYDDDWNRLKSNPFTRSHVSREVVSVKGRLQSFDLEDASTMMPVFRQDRGSLVSAYDEDQDIHSIFNRALQNAITERRLSALAEAALSKAWKVFSDNYLAALNSSEDCAASQSWLDLSTSYAQLLDALIRHAPGDRNRQQLWQPILNIGVTTVDGGSTAAIVTPWHPMRILAAAVKARYLAGLVKHLVGCETVNFGDARMFFRDLSSELAHVFYPDVCFGTAGAQAVILSVSQVCAEYSVMESPCRHNGEETATDDSPKSAADLVLKLLHRYLELQPHEAANLTAVLYNCDSARLPEALVGQLSDVYEGSGEVRCQVVLRHTDSRKLNELYGTLLRASEDNSDLYVGSEASRDFMARLRISIMADQAEIPTEMAGPPTDLVFLQDVIARSSNTTWIDATEQPAEVDILHHIPPRWSRRKPSMRDDLRSTTFLTCPLQPSVGWIYLSALHQLITGASEMSPQKILPARQISFQTNNTKDIFDEVHRLGQWVVNYDELLTKRQLRSLGVQVIRYQKLRNEGRNLLISSTAPLNLLNVLVQKRLRTFSLGLSDEQLEALAARMLDAANEISGDIVLRAAKHGCFANELIGLVLSRQLISDELGNSAHTGWYYLDDYADWLGQKEEHIADILALSPEINNGKHRLIAVVAEAKFVSGAGLSQARKTSEVQLRETLARMQDAIFGDPGRLDRDLWLGRFADLLLDGVETSPSDQLRIEQWRDAIREGSVEMILRGYSHVFLHDQADQHLTSRAEIGKVQDAWQEIFSRDVVRDLILRFHAQSSSLEIRAKLGFSPTEQPLRTIAPRVQWAVAAAQGNAGSLPSVPPLSDRDPMMNSPSSAPLETQSPIEPLTLAETTTPAPSNAPAVLHQDDMSFSWAPAPLQEVLTNIAPQAIADDSGQQWLMETSKRVRSAFLNYGLQAKLVDQRLTPNTALIRFQGSDRLKVSDVESRRSQLLTTHELRIIRVAAEPGAVVVSVARPERELVSLLKVLRNRTVDDSTNRINQSLLVGVRESNGQPLYLSPGKTHAPHTLIAGSTGSGKSVLLQNLILDIAMTNSTAAAKITLIDPKQGVDYFALEEIPHLDGRIIVDQTAAQTFLESMVAEMDDRYRQFRTARVSNITDFNRQAAADGKLPILWIVHDEFAEWMLVDAYKDLVSSTVQRLGIKARAAGIFLIFAAQRPEDRVMPLQLRDNLGNRLVLRVESEGTSRIALLEEGAERLLGKGHLAARLQGEDDLVIAQVPMLDPVSVEQIVGAICRSNP